MAKPTPSQGKGVASIAIIIVCACVYIFAITALQSLSRASLHSTETLPPANPEPSYTIGLGVAMPTASFSKLFAGESPYLAHITPAPADKSHILPALADTFLGTSFFGSFNGVVHRDDLQDFPPDYRNPSATLWSVTTVTITTGFKDRDGKGSSTWFVGQKFMWDGTHSYSQFIIANAQETSIPDPDDALVQPVRMYRIPSDVFGHIFVPAVAVCFSVLWSAVDMDIQQAEHIAALVLTDDPGITGKQLESMVHHSTSAVVAPVVSFLARQWIPFLSALLTFPLMFLVQVLGTVIVFIRPTGSCHDNARAGECRGTVEVRISIIRALQSVLGITVAVLLVLAAALAHRRAKLPTHGVGTTIADIADIMVEPERQEGLREASISNAGGHAEKLIRECRFRIINKARPALQCIRPTAEQQKTELRQKLVNQREVESVSAHEGKLSQRPFTLHRASFAGLGVLMLTSWVLVLLYRFANLPSLESWMGSRSPWPRVVMMILAFAIRTMWEPIERDARLMEPYRLLLQRHQKPKNTLFVDYVQELPIISQYAPLLRGNVRILGLQVLGILVRLLGIFMTRIPSSGASSPKSFHMSINYVCTILPIAMCALVFLFFTRKHYELPIFPYTIPTLAVYLYGSRLLNDFSQMRNEGVTGKRQQEKYLRNLGKSYGLGWTGSTDGVLRAGIDEEELVSSYPGSRQPAEGE